MSEVFGPHYDDIWINGIWSEFSDFNQKMVNHLWLSVDVILIDVSVTEATVWC